MAMHTFHLFSRACFSAAAATCFAASNERTFLAGNSTALPAAPIPKTNAAATTHLTVDGIVMVGFPLNRKGRAILYGAQSVARLARDVNPRGLLVLPRGD